MNFNYWINRLRKAPTLTTADRALRALAALGEDLDFVLHTYRHRAAWICERKPQAKGRVNRSAEHIARAARILKIGVSSH
jgi:hypothetical protein